LIQILNLKNLKRMVVRMSNQLQYESSPYLLQHKDNPVDWMPWGAEAFEKARRENKPVFLSIGYSTCHWCHVMAHESFEDEEIAAILNESYVAIKVDKEERPDIDSIYMAACQALTGSGGWPTSIFMTAEQKPFFAGTYFPKTGRYGMLGLRELLLAVRDTWETNREELLQSSEEITNFLNQKESAEGKNPITEKIINVQSNSKDSIRKNTKELPDSTCEQLFSVAAAQFRRSFDAKNGGFGSAPKFPTPHNLLFLLKEYQVNKEKDLLHMVEFTLQRMYAGGMYDHVGYGFSRYSTDEIFLVPHFEKMLYDNALLVLAYGKTYELTKNEFYRKVAEQTANYLLREMTDPEGGFYSAQDADSEGEEGKYYLWTPDEVKKVLGKKLGDEFNRFFDITGKGNFEGKNIPNRLSALRESGQKISGRTVSERDGEMAKLLGEGLTECLEPLRAYRKKRTRLHSDDKILTAWNSLAIAAFCLLYRISGKQEYLDAAQKADGFIRKELYEDGCLYVSVREGKKGAKGFLDEYASYCFAQIALYEVTLEQGYLENARKISEKALEDFFDRENGGFWLYGKENESLISRPKESYDGAIPSGNSLMLYNLVRLQRLTPKIGLEDIVALQTKYLAREAGSYPYAHAMFLVALSDWVRPEQMITAVYRKAEDIQEIKQCLKYIPSDSTVRTVQGPTEEYPLLNEPVSYYVCENRSCLPPMNQAEFLKHLSAGQ